MQNTIRRLLLNLATAVAVAATATAAFTPAALAASATATTNANIRNAPGGAVVGTLRRGETVDILGCGGGWCELDEGGFVAASLLRRDGGSGSDVGVGISIGSGGVSVGIGVGGGRPVYEDDDDDYLGEVCFFERSRYRGDSFCLEEGESVGRLDDWNDEISSFRNPDGLQVTVCARNRYRDCRTYSTSAGSLGDFDDDITSIRIR